MCLSGFLRASRGVGLSNILLLHIASFYLDTALTDIEDTLKKFIKRDDIDIILINQNVSIKQVILG